MKGDYITVSWITDQNPLLQDCKNFTDLVKDLGWVHSTYMVTRTVTLVLGKLTLPSVLYSSLHICSIHAFTQ